jgi:hypothetical protein
MSRELDALASRLLDRCGVEQKPPIDLVKLARQMNVRDITEADLIEDGRLIYSPGNARIYVRRGLSMERQRFTIAHELAHLLLLNPGTEGIVRRTRPQADGEERLCDDIAAALLLPRDWIVERYRYRPQNLSTIRHLAKQTETSLSAVTARLQEVLGWRESLLRWRFDTGKWRFVAGSGIPPSLHGSIGSASSTSVVLQAIKHERTGDVWASLPILVSGRNVGVRAQISVRGSSALVLTHLKYLSPYDSRPYPQSHPLD